MSDARQPAYTRAELADRAGIEAGFVDRLCELALLTAVDDHYTGNVAARIADYAHRGEVLVSDEVIEASGELLGVTFDSIGPVELKVLTEAVSLHVVRRAV